MKPAAGCIAILILGGCVSGPALVSEPVPYRELIRHVKHDVGTYVYNHREAPAVAGPGTPSASDGGPVDLVCGGQVSFEIESVQVTVANQLDRSRTTSAGLALEVAPVKVSGSGKVTSSLKDTVTTSLTVYPADQVIDEPPPASPYFAGTPITDTLEALASDLEATANARPCFEFRPDTKGSVNTLTWTFIVSSKTENGGKLGLVLFSAEASQSEGTSNTNTIKITLRPSGSFQPMAPPAAVLDTHLLKGTRQ